MDRVLVRYTSDLLQGVGTQSVACVSLKCYLRKHHAECGCTCKVSGIGCVAVEGTSGMLPGEGTQGMGCVSVKCYL